MRKYLRSMAKKNMRDAGYVRMFCRHDKKAGRLEKSPFAANWRKYIKH